LPAVKLSHNSRQQFEIRIDRTWDGHAVDRSEQAAVRWSRTGDTWNIGIRAPFHGDPPPPGPAGSIDRLWEYEVVEFFVVSSERSGGLPEYTEINLGPHGHYRILRFRGCRQLVEIADAIETDTVIHRNTWTGNLVVDASLMPMEPYRVNAYAIHGEDPGRRHLASIPVPGSEPDFHQPLIFRESEEFLT
jgi:hypothetical protein